MPDIPQYRQRIGATTSDLGPGPSQSAGAEFGLAAELARSAQKIQISHDAWQLADATAKATGELESFRGELTADEDFDTHSQRFIEKAKEVQDKYAGSLRGATARVFRDDFGRISQSNGVQVAIDAQKLKAQKVRTDIGSTLFDLSQLTGTDQETDDAVRAQANLAVDAGAKTGNLSYAERDALLTKFDTDASEAAIRRDMLSDPEGAEVKLAQGAYPKLSGEAQAIWAQRVSSAAYTAQQRRLAEEDRAIRLDGKARKEYADALSKQGDALLSQNKLTPAWIQQHTPNLEPADVRYFYTQLKGGGGDAPRDAMRYSDLRDRAGRGEDVRDDARDALHQGAIRSSDYDRILGEVEGARPGWYKRGSQYIGQMSGYSELNPDPAAAQSKATMLDQWNDWASAHPKSSEREAQVAYQDIVAQNSLVQIAGLPMPKYAAGTRFSFNLEESEKKTVKALQDGLIDKAEFDRQATLLKRWRDATTAPQQPTAGPK
jgi:hypothetical protein